MLLHLYFIYMMFLAVKLLARLCKMQIFFFFSSIALPRHTDIPDSL